MEILLTACWDCSWIDRDHQTQHESILAQLRLIYLPLVPVVVSQDVDDAALEQFEWRGPIPVWNDDEQALVKDRTVLNGIVVCVVCFVNCSVAFVVGH